jgi:hypothetical protein
VIGLNKVTEITCFQEKIAESEPEIKTYFSRKTMHIEAIKVAK